MKEPVKRRGKVDEETIIRIEELFGKVKELEGLLEAEKIAYARVEKEKREKIAVAYKTSIFYWVRNLRM